MNQHKRKVYLRKKGKTFIFECKVKGKTKYLWTIPQPYDKFLKELCKSSFLHKDKSTKIMTTLMVSDYVDVYPQNKRQELRIIDNTRNLEKDDLDIDEEINELVNKA